MEDFARGFGRDKLDAGKLLPEKEPGGCNREEDTGDLDVR